MANSEYSNYFTVVVYPLEFTRWVKLLDLGYIYQSPVHYSNEQKINSPDIAYNFYYNEFSMTTSRNAWTMTGKQKNGISI